MRRHRTLDQDNLGGASLPSRDVGKSTLTSRIMRQTARAAVGTTPPVARDEGGVAANAGEPVARATESASDTPLPDEVRGRFETWIGTDLSAVRVHNGEASAAAADAVGARAFATGADIHFAAGEYDPTSRSGLHLLAHEVAHTVQQSGAAPTTQFQLDVSNHDDADEVEANRAADALIEGRPAAVMGGGHPRTARAVEQAPTAPTAPMAKDHIMDPDVRATGDETPRADGSGQTAHEQPAGGARALDEMGNAFGRSFDDVHLHTGEAGAARAADAGAGAVTTGSDIYFAPGAFDPGSARGDRLLAHELAHVVQQDGAATPQPWSEPVGGRGDAFEREAHRAADDVLAGLRPTIALSTSTPIAMRDEEAPTRLGYQEYVEKHAHDISTGVAAALAGFDVDPQCPFATCEIAPLLDNTVLRMTMVPSVFLGNLVSLCAPDSPMAAVDRGRNAGDDGKSDDRFAPAVATELRNILARRLGESVQRMVPRFVRATHQAYVKAGDGGSTDIDHPPLPPPDNVVWSAPIDRYVGPSLFHTVTCDLRRYEQAHPDEQDIAQPRVVKWEFAAQAASSASEGKANWVRVTETLDPPATAEDVALSIFGTSSKASFIVAAPPLFGFTHPELLISYNYEQWKQLPGTDPSDDPEAQYDKLNADPAAQILTGPGADNAALAQSSGIQSTAKGDKESVAKRIRATSLVVDSLISSAQTVPGLDAARLIALKQRLDDRADQVAHTPLTGSGQASPWDAQSVRQLDLVGSCAGGLDTAARNWKVLTSGSGGSPAAFAADPVLKLGAAFVDAAAVSDLIETGAMRLAAANVVLRDFPIDVCEGLLSYARAQLEAAERMSGLPDVGKTPEQLAEKEEALRRRLSAMRDTIAGNPGAVAAELDALRAEIDQLKLVATVLALAGRSTELWDTLDHLGESFAAHLDLSKAKHPLDSSKWEGSKYAKYSTAKAKLDALQGALRARVIELAKAGDLAGAQAALPAIQAQYGALFPEIAALIEDEETKEEWIKIGVMIGAGVVSGGFGEAVAAVGEASFGIEGGLAAEALKTSAETAMYTAITTAVFEKDPTVAGVVQEFLKNAATFSLVAAAMKSYEALLPELSKTTLGKGTAVLAMFTAHCTAGLIVADTQKYKATGQHLSNEEAKDAVLEGVLTTIGTLIAEHSAHQFLNGLHVASAHLSNELKVINASIELLHTQAVGLEAPGANPEQAKAAARELARIGDQQKSVLDELDRITADPAAAKSAGASDADVAAIKQSQGDRDAAAGDVETARLLELSAHVHPLGGGVSAVDGTGMFQTLVDAHVAAGSHVTVTGAAGDRIAVIETAAGQTLRVVEDEGGAVGAKPPMSPAETAHESTSETDPADLAAFKALSEKHPGLATELVNQSTTNLERIARLPESQLVKLEALGEQAFRRIVTMPQPMFERFIALPPAELTLFAGLAPDSLARFEALTEPQFARIAALDPAKIQGIAAMPDADFAKATGSAATADAAYLQKVADFKGVHLDEVTNFYEEMMVLGVDHNQMIEAALAKYPTLTRAEADSIFGYTTKLFYRDLNEVLNAGGNPEAARLSTLLEKGLASMPAAAPIQYRGLRLGSSAEVAAFDAEYALHAVVETKAYWSTGPDPGNAYAGGRTLVIHTTAAKDISELAFGVHFHGLIGKPTYSAEGIISPGIRFRVVNIDHAAGIVTLQQI